MHPMTVLCFTVCICDRCRRLCAQRALLGRCRYRMYCANSLPHEVYNGRQSRHCIVHRFRTPCPSLHDIGGEIVTDCKDSPQA
eukprot:1040992-Prymnesium_polylepis.1